MSNTTKAPAYLQIYNRVKNLILQGTYPTHSKLPSKRDMAAKMGVSTITIEHAYALLFEEGYVEARERSGFFVIFRSSDGFASSGEQQVVHRSWEHSQDTFPEFPISVLTKTMRRVMNDYGNSILEKSPNAGCVELREAIQKYLARNRSIYAQIDQIVIGSGAEYIYNLIVGLFGRDTIFALESPSYEKIQQVYRSSGVDCELLPLGSDGIESTALANSKATVLHLSPYRSFPTGITASASKRHEYIRWAERNHRFLVEDDFESEFSVSRKPEETLFTLSGKDNVIYINTFTKTISPALRIGYMVLPKCLVPTFSQKLGFYSCTVPTFEQFVLAELISSGDFERHINRVRRAKRKQILSEK